MKQSDNMVDYFPAIEETSRLDIVAHVYPTRMRFSYDFDMLPAFAKCRGRDT